MGEKTYADNHLRIQHWCTRANGFTRRTHRGIGEREAAIAAGVSGSDRSYRQMIFPSGIVVDPSISFRGG